MLSICTYATTDVKTMEPGVRKRIVLLLRIVIKLPFIPFLEMYGIEHCRPSAVCRRIRMLEEIKNKTNKIVKIGI
jgi:hypothetical protein